MKAMTDSMCELEQILRIHAGRYPRMQPADAVKLICQNEFGGGHLVSDTERFRSFLHMEYASVTKHEDAPRYEVIGNGIVRVNLAALRESELDRLSEIFIQSSRVHAGCQENFLEKLALLERLAADGLFSFSREALRQYLDQYAKQGYPTVSHSEAYRQTYRPAYRIDLRDLIEIFS